MTTSQQPGTGPVHWGGTHERGKAMAKKVRTINDQIADAVKGQAAAKAEKAAKAKAAKQAQPKAAPKATAARKPGNLRTTGLPNKVRSLRLKAGLTPDQLASKAGQDLTASHVRRIERGVRHATTGQQAAIAKALGTDVAALGIKEPKASTASKPRQPKAQPIDASGLEVGEVREVEIA